MKKTNNKTLTLTLIGLSYLVVVALAALIADVDTAWWQGLAFLTFAAAVGVAVVLIFGAKKVADILFRMPIYMAGVAYYAVAGLLSFVYMLTGIPGMTVMLILQLLALAALAALVILTMMQENAVGKATANVKLRNDFIRSMTVRVDNIALAADDNNLRGKLENLAEEFRFSRPVARPELAAVEADIQLAVEELAQQVAQGGDVEAQLHNIKRMLLQRNNTAKLLK